MVEYPRRHSKSKIFSRKQRILLKERLKLVQPSQSKLKRLQAVKDLKLRFLMKERERRFPRERM